MADHWRQVHQVPTENIHDLGPEDAKAFSPKFS